MEKKNNTWIIVLLVLIILGLVGYICFDKFIVNKNTSNVEQKNANQDKTEKKMTENEILSIGKELYEKTSFSSAWKEYFFYKYKEYDAMPDAVRGYIALSFTDSKDFTIKRNDNCQSNDELCKNKVIINRSVYENKYFEIFGKEKNVYYGTVDMVYFGENLNLMICNIDKNNDSIECLPTNGGDSISKLYNLSFDGAELSDKSLIVYSKMLVIDMANEVIYSDYDQKNSVASYESNMSEASIIQKYKDEAGKYKLTFNQDKDGNWYWVSTEFVK